MRLASDSPIGGPPGVVGRCGRSVGVLGLNCVDVLTYSGRKAAEAVPSLPVRRGGNLVAVPEVLRIPISMADLTSKSGIPEKRVSAPVSSRVEP